ncbi:unnamed protein product [Caretta caretta]
MPPPRGGWEELRWPPRSLTGCTSATESSFNSTGLHPWDISALGDVSFSPPVAVQEVYSSLSYRHVKMHVWRHCPFSAPLCPVEPCDLLMKTEKRHEEQAFGCYSEEDEGS